MTHRLLQFPSKWEWLVLNEQRPETSGLSRSSSRAAGGGIAEAGLADHAEEPASAKQASAAAMKQAYPELSGWLSDIEGNTHNQIIVSELAGGESVLQGTLMFQVSEDETDVHPLHFRVTQSMLVTLAADMRLSIRLQLDPWQDKLNRCQSAPEGFFVVLGSILETFHSGLDRFETRLGDLEQKMRLQNRTGLMNNIFERRYELLHWSHLFIPIKEIQGAAKEAFMDTLLEQEEYKRMELKLERIEALLSHYAMEIDTLLMMDDAISNFRGNDIMKTLTIFTALFMPATVIGAVWGMNFKRIPWAGEPWGFIAVCSIIVVVTMLIYWWLWHKGWTGDLLTGRRRGEIVGAGTRIDAAGADDLDLPRPLPSRSSRGSAPRGAGSASSGGARDEQDAPLPSRSSR
ncbi:Mg2+ and Co2+ transporter CorA [Paenibacillus taihuensis]|uniref:Mg2+ and Co2+ transporter CorA n=1 Tax=Paenibacillus taihuensis TaxID=1156355 RepID=A0A3D9QU58_9BACL|nr:magnesium transporter CorA family protein [Paenibacillus taihuensis]REE66965.1 Mg2+ and Co2+ transporter CorA [Paenibacillus taihuensis]